MRLSAAGEDAEVVAQTRDLATGGMFVAVPEPRPVGTAMGFRVELGTGDAPDVVEGEAVVVWLREEPAGPDQPAGMGMRFTRVETPGVERLAMLISDQAPAAPDVEAAPSTEEMPEDPPDQVQVDVEAAAPGAADSEVEAETEGGIEVESASAGAPPADPGGEAPRVELFGDLAGDDGDWTGREPERPAWVWPTVAGAVLVAVALFFLRGWFVTPGDTGPAGESGAGAPESAPAAAAPAPAEPAVEGPVEPAAAAPAAVAAAVPDESVGPAAESSGAPARPEAPALVPSTPAAAAPPAHATALRTITASVRDDITVVEIVGNAPFRRHHVMPLDAPPRLVVRLIGVQRAHDAGGVGAPRLRGVRTGVHGRGATRNLHVVLDLAAPDIAATVERRGDRVVVNLSD